MWINPPKHPDKKVKNDIDLLTDRVVKLEKYFMSDFWKEKLGITSGNDFSLEEDFKEFDDDDDLFGDKDDNFDDDF